MIDQNLAGGREVLLHPHHRIILAGVLAGDVVQPLGADRRGLVAVVPAPDRFHHVTVVVPQQGGQIIENLGSAQLGPVVFGVVDVLDAKAEALGQLGAQEQARRVHPVGKGQIERQVVSTRLGLVGHEHQKWLVGPGLGGHFGDGRSHALDITAEGADQQILAGAIEALRLGGVGAGPEGAPDEAVNPLVVDHEDSDVVAGGGDVDWAIPPGLTS